MIKASEEGTVNSHGVLSILGYEWPLQNAIHPPRPLRREFRGVVKYRFNFKTKRLSGWIPEPISAFLTFVNHTILMPPWAFHVEGSLEATPAVSSSSQWNDLERSKKGEIGDWFEAVKKNIAYCSTINTRNAPKPGEKSRNIDVS